MTERYHGFLKRLYGLTRFGEKFDLSGPRALQHFLGWPLEDYPSVLIGGTNGKGGRYSFSSTAFAASVCGPDCLRRLI